MARRKRVERYRIREFRNSSGSISWRVTGNTPSGARIRENFGDRTAAIERRAELEKEAEGVHSERLVQRTILSAAQISDAEAAIGISEGRSLIEIVSAYKDLESRAEAKLCTLRVAIAFFESHYRPELVGISVFEAREKFLAARANRRPATVQFYEQSTALLLRPEPNRQLHLFSVADIEQVLNRFKNVNTVRAYRNGIIVFFNWAKRRHFCLENPCDGLDGLPEDTSQISILNLTEVKRLLTASVKYVDGEMAASVAIALFAGLRPSELEELRPEDIRRDSIRVRGGKRREFKRVVPIPPTLKAWLRRFPFNGHPQGWQRRMRNLKHASKARRWVKDILRHTSISFQAERDKDEALTVFDNGTSKKMMDRHYRAVIDDPEELNAFWKLTPKILLRENIVVELPRQPKVLWPSDKQLAKLVMTAPLTRVGAQVGVSDVAVRKRCLARKIPLPTHKGGRRRVSQAQV